MYGLRTFAGPGSAILTSLSNVDWNQASSALTSIAQSGASAYVNVASMKAQQQAQQQAAQQLALQQQLTATTPTVNVQGGGSSTLLLLGGMGLLALGAVLLMGKKKGGRRRNPLGIEPVSTAMAVATGISALVGAVKVGYDIRSGAQADRINQTMAAHQQVQQAQLQAYQQGAQLAAENLERAKTRRNMLLLGGVAVLGLLAYFYKGRS